MIGCYYNNTGFWLDVRINNSNTGLWLAESTALPAWMIGYIEGANLQLNERNQIHKDFK